MSTPKTGTAPVKQPLKNAKPVKRTAADILAHVFKGSKGAIGAFAVLIVAACLFKLVAASLIIAGGAKLALLYLMPDGEAKSGRSGSVVYMRNGRRRNFKVPAHIVNSYTQAIRVAFGLNSSAWNGLTPSQVAAWNAFSMDSTDRFGRKITIRGKQAFVKLNQNLYNVGVVGLTDPPALSDVPCITSIVPTLVSTASVLTTARLAFDPTPTQAGIVHMLFATSPKNSGITRPSSSDYRLIGLINAGSVSPHVALADYIAKWGASVTIGQNIFFKTVGVNTTTGQNSPEAAGYAAVS